MDRWKSRGGKSQRREEKKNEDPRRERVRGKKMQVREKVENSRNTVFYHWFVAPKIWKVGSLKRRVRSQLARWEMKSCTPLWREAHFEVKSVKNWRSQTFGSWDVEKVHAFGAKHISKSKCTKHTRQNCSVFWCCEVPKLRKSRRIASFLMLSTWTNEKVSQNSLVFKLADR